MSEFVSLVSTLLLVIIIALLIQRFIFTDNTPYERYYLPGLLGKLLGALAFGFIYKVYYKNGGDTILYFEYGKLLAQQFWYQPHIIWQILNANAGDFIPDAQYILANIGYYRAENTFLVVKITAICSVLTFNSFWASTILFASVAYSGIWAMYYTLVRIYPKQHFSLAIAVLFLPSVFFWSSGILKDTLTLASLGWLFFSFYHIFIAPRNIVLNSFIFILTCMLINILKGYVLIAFLPGIAYWTVVHYGSFIKDNALRAALIFVGIMFLSVVIYFKGANIQQGVNNLFLQFVQKAFDFQWWHGYLNETRGQTGYELGEIDLSSPLNIFYKFPAAVNVALFRPYLYEANSPVVLISAIESTAFLLFTIYTFFKVGLVKAIQIIVNTPLLTAFLIFTLLFAFVVGFTSYNFGALARYKIPCLPFYASFLVILLNSKKQQSVMQ